MFVIRDNEQLIVQFSKYHNNDNTALLLTTEENEAYAVASVNGDTVLPPNVLAVKDWSENSGMADDLIKAGIIEEAVLGMEVSGFVMINHYKLTPGAEALRQKHMEEQ